MLVYNQNIFAQGGQKFATGGNSLSSGEFLGSTNNFGLLFKTNNQPRFEITANGVVKVYSFTGTGNRLLQTDANGNITPLTMSNANFYLAGDGQWTKFPTANLLWDYDSNGDLAPTNTGARVSLLNTLTLWDGLTFRSMAGNGVGFLKIDDNGKVSSLPIGTSNQYLNGLGQWADAPAGGIWQYNANNLYWMPGNVGIGINNPQYKLDVDGDVFVRNNLYVGGAILITDKVKATSEVKTAKIYADTLMMDSTKMIGKTDMQTATVKDSIVVGEKLPAGSSAMAQALEGLKVKLAVNGGAAVNGKLSSVSTETIDATVVGSLTLPGFANTDTTIVKTLYIDNNGVLQTSNAKVHPIDPGCKVVTNPQSWNQKGNDFSFDDDGFHDLCLKMGTTSNHSFAVVSNNQNRVIVENDGSIVFPSKGVLKNNGTWVIGPTNTTVTGNYKLVVVGKVGARDFKVTQASNWPDFVFEKDYKLNSIAQTELFIKQHKHLPGMPAASEVEKEGFDLGEMIKLQQEQIEKQMLYIIELEKRLKAVEAK